jgi:arylsulfatase A-like enzyme
MVLTLLSFAALSMQAAPKPNVVLIMTDDQGYGDLSCH